jgi:hypothetical protein
MEQRLGCGGGSAGRAVCHQEIVTVL